MKYNTIELITKIFVENKESLDDRAYEFFFCTVDALASEYCTHTQKISNYAFFYLNPFMPLQMKDRKPY